MAQRSASPAIQADHLTKRYRDQVAVKNLTLTVPRGVVFGMLGPNGAGKSTTLGMLTTLLRPTSGSAHVAGRDVQHDPRAARAAIGIVFQEEMLDLDLSVRANLDLHARLHHIPHAQRRARVQQALEFAGLTQRERSRTGQLSGGLRRRLEVARGLMHTPEVLFLDEPTVGLDIESRRAIWTEVERLRRRGDVTIVLTSHYLEEADRLCDVVAIIDRGTIRAQGSPEELKRALGDDVVHARVVQPAAALNAALARVPGVQDVHVQGGEVRLKMSDGERRVPALIEALQSNTQRVRSFRIEPPTLEDVFLNATGHAMSQDDES
ncbi:MAG: ATP-binding cassette domain-containing protein [Candidatus Andersenbacteria bacterium]